MEKVKCLNCGFEFLGNVKNDKLGNHCICPKCNSSFDVDTKITTLYHCTDKCYKDSILRDGLKTNNGTIYLSYKPEYCFGNTCFEIDVTELNIESTCNSWEYICNTDIDSGKIKYFGFFEEE